VSDADLSVEAVDEGPEALALALEHTDIRLKTDAPETWEYSRHVAELLDRSGSLSID
jgi:hypothetical protein